MGVAWGFGNYRPVAPKLSMKGNQMKLTSDQISALRNVSPELADKLEAGESVTVEREVKHWLYRGCLTDYGHKREAICTLKLLAYREEFAPGYVVPEIGEWAHYPCRNEGGWRRVQSLSRNPTTVYMPKEVVEDLCRKLNSGEVVL